MGGSRWVVMRPLGVSRPVVVRGVGRCSGDVGGADAVAVGDGRQPLDVGAEQAAEHRGLGLAQLRELAGHVRDRAVVLAELPARRRSVRGRGGVTLGAERGGERLGPGRWPGVAARGVDGGGRGVAETRPAGGRTPPATASPPCAREEAQRGRRRGRRRRAAKPCPAGVGEREDPGGAAAAARAARRCSRGSQRPSATRASRWRRTAAGVSSRRCGELGRRGRAVLEQRAGDPRAGGVLARRPRYPSP